MLYEKLTIESLNRVIYVEMCNIESLYRYFKRLRQTHQVLIFPYHLKESKQRLHVWDAQKRTDDIFIDLMSELDKQNVRLCRHHNTFRKTQCNVWNDRPELIENRRSLESGWEPSVHDLIHEDLILFISLTDNQTKEMKEIKISLHDY